MEKSRKSTKQEFKNQVGAILKEIRKTGFVVVPNLLSDEEVTALRESLETLVIAEAAAAAPPQNHQRVLYLALKDERFLTPLCHPLVLAVWRSYLGEDMICSSLSSNTVYPGGGQIYWHVDYPHWTMSEPYPTFPLAAQAIWMLDDFTPENGATAAIPKSHRHNYRPRFNDKWVAKATVLTGNKGSVILADGAFWHTSGQNLTGNFRHALLIKYIRSVCLPQEDMRWQLSMIDNPSDTVYQLFGGNQYRPTSPGDPY